MFHLTRTIRTLLIAGLALSLSLVGVVPVVLASTRSGAEESHGPGNGTCCCGTKDGRCCGMACCRTSPPTEKHESPAVPRSEDDRSPVAVLAVACTVHSVAGGTAFHNAVFAGVPVAGSPTQPDAADAAGPLEPLMSRR